MSASSAAPAGRRLSRVLSSVGLGLATQAVGFVVGILIIRSLSRGEYTAYSLSAAVTGAVVVIADSGINSTLMSAAARAEHAGRFRALFTAALHRRRSVWAVVILPTLALLLYLLLQTGVPPIISVAITVVTGALSFNSLSLGLAAIDFQLSGRFRVSQGLDALNTAARALLIGGAAVLGLGSVVLYLVLALVIGTVQRVVMTQQIRARHADVGVSDADRRLFTLAVRSTLAASVLLIVGEQLVNVILVQRHNPLAIADVTALGRFAVAFQVLNVVMANLAAPYLAKAGRLRRGVAVAAGRVMGVYALACVAFLVVVALFAPLLLRLLGPQYEGLEAPLVIVSAGGALSNFALYGLGQVNHARGWVAHSWTYGLFLAAWIGYGVFVVDVSTPVGASLLFATLSVPTLLSHVVRFAGGLSKLRRQEA